MGANASTSALEPDGPKPKKLSDVPESCIASVLSYLDPPEICDLARLNRAFRDASSADFIWESKLPSNYVCILRKLFQDQFFTHLTQRDIFALLSKPITFDGLHKVFLLLSISLFFCMWFNLFFSKSIKFSGFKKCT